MSDARQPLSRIARELKTYRIRGTFKKDDGSVLTAAELTALTLKLFNEATGAFIIGPTGQSILNTDRGTVDANGVLVCTFLPADNPIIDDTLTNETHVAFFEWEYGGTKKGGIEVAYKVRNFVKAP